MQSVTGFWPPLQGKSKDLTWIQGAEEAKIMTHIFFWCHKSPQDVVHATQRKGTPVSEWLHQWHQLRKRLGNHQSPDQKREGDPCSATRGSGRQQEHLQAESYPGHYKYHIIQPSVLSLTTVWPTRAGFSSRTPGTLRREAYPEPWWAHSHLLWL